MSKFLFFDNASTTQCCDEAVELVQKFAREEFGNPSSAHAMGQQAACAIKEARRFFAGVFNIEPNQIIFTGSGSEADNLAVYGVALDALAKRRHGRVLASATEHAAVRKTVKSLTDLGLDSRLLGVDGQGQIDQPEFEKNLIPQTILVSIQQVNNISGAILPVEELARFAKSKVRHSVFHSDCVQAFGKIEPPKGGSPVDLVSISAHKVKGPKGVGALIVLNKHLLKEGMRPLIWGGDQESGFRSGTQSTGLIAGFHAAAKLTLEKREKSFEHARELQQAFRQELTERGLIDVKPGEKRVNSTVRWNSPEKAVPHIVSFSVPGYPSPLIAKMLEDRSCIVSMGSACSSHKSEPDPVLCAMNLPPAIYNSALRVSFADCNSREDVHTLVAALEDSIQQMKKLLGG